MLIIENMYTLITQRIVLSVITPVVGGTYYVLNTYGWTNEDGKETYQIHLRHINKKRDDIMLVLNRFQIDNRYVLYNKDRPMNSLLMTKEQIGDKQTFLKGIELVMIMK